MASWFLLADDRNNLVEGGLQVLEIESRKICIARYDGVLHAFAAACPHQGAPLAEGRIDSKGNIVCPIHQYRFNMKNGYNCSGEGYHLKTYSLKEEAGKIYISL